MNGCYRAPWGKGLIGCSVVFSALAVMAVFGVPPLLRGVTMHWMLICSQWFMAVLVLLTLPFMVLGYEITPEAFLIRRLLWKTRISRAGLKSAEAIPGAMKGSIRLCGNGGLFSFTGWYWNKTVGNYQAFVTDMKLPVVLRFAGKNVIVSPERPDEFVEELLR